MAIIGTFNGQNIVALPSSPAPSTVEFSVFDTVSTVTNPFTGQQQMQDWGTGWLEATITLPPLTHAQAQIWTAFLLQLRGQLGLFQFGDPLAIAPQGSGSGSPTVSGNNQSGYQLVTRGWTENASGVLLPGDWLQIGYRLYRCLDTVNADASGAASFNVWPQLRESPADGDALILRNARGLFRLASNQRKWSIAESRTYGVTFEIREAL